MATTDIALREDLSIKISKILENPEEFAVLLQKLGSSASRDMGPKSRYMGQEVPEEDVWKIQCLLVLVITMLLQLKQTNKLD